MWLVPVAHAPPSSQLGTRPHSYYVTSVSCLYPSPSHNGTSPPTKSSVPPLLWSKRATNSTCAGAPEASASVIRRCRAFKPAPDAARGSLRSRRFRIVPTARVAASPSHCSRARFARAATLPSRPPQAPRAPRPNAPCPRLSAVAQRRNLLGWRRTSDWLAGLSSRSSSAKEKKLPLILYVAPNEYYI